MSLGYGCDAKLVDEDGKSALYVYRSFNWNIGVYEPPFDGTVYLERAPIDAQRRYIVSRSHPQGILDPECLSVDCIALLDSGALVIKNCSSAWKLGLDQNVDLAALTLVDLIAEHIIRNGEFPPTMSYLK